MWCSSYNCVLLIHKHTFSLGWWCWIRCFLPSPNTVSSPRGSRCLAQYLPYACALPRPSEWRISNSVSNYYFHFPFPVSIPLPFPTFPYAYVSENSVKCRTTIILPWKATPFEERGRVCSPRNNELNNS